METNRPIVLVVDEPDQLIAINELLQDSCRVKLADNVRDALQIAHDNPGPALIVQQAGLRDRAGTLFGRLLKDDLASFDIPVIALVDGDAGAAAALAEGACDYVTRAALAIALPLRVALQLQLRQARAQLADRAGQLEALVEERTCEVVKMHDATILAVASLAETRDSDTCNHIRRTQHYIVALARALAEHPRFCAELTIDNIALLYRAAPLHDVGKVRVPDAILLKPGRLTDQEYEIMKLHTVYGRDAIVDVEQHLGSSNNFLRFAREIAYSHQEKWDGSGYPQGLAGEQIPLAARLMAVADVYDAMISKRIYKPAFTHETALELIRQGRGEHFDPDVVDAMLSIEEEIMDIAARFADLP